MNTKGTIRTIVYGVTFSALSAVTALPVSAESIVNCGNGIDKTTGLPTEVCKYTDLITTVDNLVRIVLLEIAVPVIVGFIIYGGIVIMTSGGNTNRVQKGKNIVKSAVIGVVLALGAWLIVKTILSIFFSKYTQITLTQ